jgi:hypothetical protein
MAGIRFEDGRNYRLLINLFIDLFVQVTHRSRRYLRPPERFRDVLHPRHIKYSLMHGENTLNME